MCSRVCTCTLWELVSLLPSRAFQALSSGCQSRQQAPLPAKPSHRIAHGILKGRQNKYQDSENAVPFSPPTAPCFRREQHFGKGPMDPYLCTSVAPIMRASVFCSCVLLTKEVCWPWALYVGICGTWQRCESWRKETAQLFRNEMNFHSERTKRKKVRGAGSWELGWAQGPSSCPFSPAPPNSSYFGHLRRPHS